MKVFNEEIIENFAEPVSEEASTYAVNWLETLFSEVLEETRKKNPLITSDFKFAFVGDYMSETAIPNSTLDVFLSFKSPQLEINSLKFSKDYFKKFWLKIKRSYKQIRLEKMSKRRRKKHNKKQEKEIIIPENKFTILDLKQLLIREVLKKLSTESYVTITSTGFKIVAREEIGIDINLIPAIHNEEGYKIYDELKGEFHSYNFDEFEQNIVLKIEQVGESYLEMVRVFKNIYFNLNNRKASDFFMESVLYNVPDDLYYSESFYYSFMKILNYLRNANFKDFKLVYDKSQNLFTSKMIDESPVTILNLIKKVDQHL